MELDAIRKELFYNVRRTSPMEIQHESGLDLVTSGFKKKDRSWKQQSQMTEYLFHKCQPLLENEETPPNVAYFIDQLLKEANELNPNYQLRFKEQLEYYEGSVSKLVKLFTTVPFNLLTEEQILKLKSYGRKKGEAIDYALKCFFAAVDVVDM